jgi:hypothetical protein
MFVLGLAVGVFVGGVAVGLLAHRKPEWFARVVVLGNEASEVVNEAVQKVAKK